MITKRNMTTLTENTAHVQIDGLRKLTGAEAATIREMMEEFMCSWHEKVYINTKDVTDADLSGINEIIHLNYRLQQHAKKLVLVYRKDSVIAKWVETTSLDQFTETAILPAE